MKQQDRWSHLHNRMKQETRRGWIWVWWTIFWRTFLRGVFSPFRRNFQFLRREWLERKEKGKGKGGGGAKNVKGERGYHENFWWGEGILTEIYSLFFFFLFSRKQKLFFKKIWRILRVIFLACWKDERSNGWEVRKCWMFGARRDLWWV